MSDEKSFNFGKTERTEIEGPVKVTDVVGVEVGEKPLPHPDDTEVTKETHTLWIDVGDKFQKEDPDLGEFEITILTIYEVEEEDRDTWYEIEAKYQPIVSEDADEDITRSPLIKKQAIRSFAQEAVNHTAIGSAGKPPEKRDVDTETKETV